MSTDEVRSRLEMLRKGSDVDQRRAADSLIEESPSDERASSVVILPAGVNPTRRASAVLKGLHLLALRRCDSRDVIRELTPFLKDTDMTVRQVAIAVSIGTDPLYHLELCKLALREQPAVVKAVAIETLGWHSMLYPAYERDVRYILSLALCDRDARVRLEAARMASYNAITGQSIGVSPLPGVIDHVRSGLQHSVPCDRVGYLGVLRTLGEDGCTLCVTLNQLLEEQLVAARKLDDADLASTCWYEVTEGCVQAMRQCCARDPNLSTRTIVRYLSLLETFDRHYAGEVAAIDLLLKRDRIAYDGYYKTLYGWLLRKETDEHAAQDAVQTLIRHASSLAYVTDVVDYVFKAGSDESRIAALSALATPGMPRRITERAALRAIGSANALVRIAGARLAMLAGFRFGEQEALLSAIAMNASNSDDERAAAVAALMDIPASRAMIDRVALKLLAETTATSRLTPSTRIRAILALSPDAHGTPLAQAAFFEILDKNVNDVKEESSRQALFEQVTVIRTLQRSSREVRAIYTDALTAAARSGPPGVKYEVLLILLCGNSAGDRSNDVLRKLARDEEVDLVRLKLQSIIESRCTVSRHRTFVTASVFGKWRHFRARLRWGRGERRGGVLCNK